MLFREGISREVKLDSDVYLKLKEKGKVIGIEIWNTGESGLINK